MGKESFLIYKSFYKPIARLSDKQLGRLFRAIFKYQLGEEVTVEEDIEMAFGFFINQFEIDETKYHGIVERNRNNGRKGGAPVGNCNAKLKQPKQPSGLNSTQTTQNKPNDNDNDNVNESPNGDKVDAFLPEISDKPLKECYEELSANSSWIETVVINKRSAGHQDFTLEHFQEYLKKFFEKLQNEGEVRKSPKDGMAHFVRWLDIELGKSKTDMYKAANEQLLLSVKEDKKGYYQFLSYIKRQAPYCFSNMRLPTEEEFLLLRGKYGNEMFKSALRTIEGRSDIRSKWDVLYYAVLKQIEYQNGS
nr:MAG: protein of unknown function DUF1376 [Bacteriophage sp.]